MQKIILASLIVFAFGGRLAYAEAPLATDNSPADENQANMQQDEFVKIMQDNLFFEKEKRQLANEVALEKLRSELKKLRGTGTSPVMPTMTETKAPAVEVSHPYVVLVTKIGGLTRVLVSDGRNKHYLSVGEHFSSGGKSYVLTTEGKGKYQVKESRK
ncbi:hypothetical protein I3F86_002207 [Salmonella enterica]|uniref:hypothetical protein n=1 Tax=Salmonella enterica TaxID=28901 RepID=UPI0009AC172A|nr:hypothetical protein [Salmonella enterica]ECB7874620.1 hypothetical protein [Salmonella enterica subsp. enterica serovar Stanley]EBF4234770.1 hypothetical protein [Salmonella enterica]EDQ7955130.1 hypothetical protein [Salmonella enterica subsp. enterica serovar Oslo]EGS9941585.1 hypothetical protein [Salmonella enterica]EHG2547254.1 hypothetical protein [Salmonella enterica]